MSEHTPNAAIAAETPAPPPEAAQDAPEHQTGPSPTPLTVDAALAALRDVARDHPDAPLAIAIGNLVDAMAEERDHTPPPPTPEIAASWAGAVEFMGNLQHLLDRMDADRHRNANAVLAHVFGLPRPQTNGAGHGMMG